MSSQRAYVNCERCYGLAKNTLGNSTEPKTEDDTNNLLNSDSLYTARNEAMKALESVGGNELFADKAIECLDACVACDFSKPAIKDFIDKIWKKEKSK